MMRMLKAIPRPKAGATCALWLLLVMAPALDAQPQPPKDFVAVDESQPGEQIPALPLIAGAYGFIWIALLGYVWSVGRRLQKVEGELAELNARRKSPYAEATGDR